MGGGIGQMSEIYCGGEGNRTNVFLAEFFFINILFVSLLSYC